MTGSALLIKERLKLVSGDGHDAEEEIHGILEEHDVHYLSVDHVTRIIGSRVDWPKVC